MYISVYSIKETGETIETCGYKFKTASFDYLLSVRSEHIIGINMYGPELKSDYLHSGYVDVNRKDELMKSYDAQQIANVGIEKDYYEVFLSEEARKVLPGIDRFFINSNGYSRVIKN